jgi:hypothetical protein
MPRKIDPRLRQKNRLFIGRNSEITPGDRARRRRKPAACEAQAAEFLLAARAVMNCDAYDDLRLRVLFATTLAAGGDAEALRRDENLCRQGPDNMADMTALKRFMRLPPETRARLTAEYSRASAIADRRRARRDGGPEAGTGRGGTGGGAPDLFW